MCTSYYKFYLQSAQIVYREQISYYKGSEFFSSGYIQKSADAVDGVSFEDAKSGCLSVLRRFKTWLEEDEDKNAKELRAINRLIENVNALDESDADKWETPSEHSI